MKLRKKVTWYYLHTLDGKPAAFDGRQVCYCWNGSSLVASLKQLRAEQKASATWQRSKGYLTDHTYGYRRVRLPV